MADIQQQVADGARPRLARVGDVIEHGQDIPANVVRLADASEDVLDRPTAFWSRRAPGMYSWRDYGDRCDLASHSEPEWWPMTVVEVDPEPQPAERKLIGPARAHQDAPCTDACYEPAGAVALGGPGDREPDGPLLGLATTRQLLEELKARRITAPSRGEAQRLEDGAIGLLRALSPAALGYRTAGPRAESGPLVLTLPQVPDGAVALKGETTGTRYARVRVPGIMSPCWKPDPWSQPMDLGAVLDGEGRVTVEMAPPREPRTWPKLDPPDPETLAVRGASGIVYRRRSAEEGA